MRQVGEVVQRVGTVNQAVGDLLVAAANGDRPELDMADIRELVRRLVSLGGAVTELGVALGIRAEDLVRGDESR
ncbi:MAG TPA: hypothetical protein VFW65_30660 [Pseudonocardiaceae bacterium]|nr:hypothetical protein [Pseudonocardiaceae bacterium]